LLSSVSTVSIWPTDAPAHDGEAVFGARDGRNEYHVDGWGAHPRAPGTQQVHPPWALRHQEAFMQLSNSRRALVVAVLGAALLALGGSALGAAGKGKGSAKAKIVIKGGESFKTNAYIKDSVHFVGATVTVRSGGTVTLTNTSKDGHTLSIVKQSQLPRTINQIENCSVCGEVAKSHGVNPSAPPSGPPPIPLVNVGPPGFNQPGDSVIIGPKGHGGPVTFKVTAPAGTTLSFMCAIHPWMQGRILVK
jgi:plastocyanin